MNSGKENNSENQAPLFLHPKHLWLVMLLGLPSYHGCQPETLNILAPSRMMSYVAMFLHVHIKSCMDGLRKKLITDFLWFLAPKRI